MKCEKLEIDKNYVPCQEGDEFYPNGYFVLNITRLWEYISKNKNLFSCTHLIVSEYYRPSDELDFSFLPYVDLEEPVLLGEIAPGKYNLIDGHHRMERAYRDGIEELPAYKIGVKHLQKFFTEKKRYEAHVQYWNDKVDLYY